MKRRALWVFPALAAGAALSALKLWYHCLEPISEACVWGKSLFRLTLPLETIVFGGAILLIGFLLRALLFRP
jgi:hypothetical protein